MERPFEIVMIEQCAPALAGLKPAGLFRVEARDRAALYARAAGWDGALRPRGLRVCVLCEQAQSHTYLIYVFREKQLRPVLARPEVQAYLRGRGYHRADACGGYLCQLAQRLRAAPPFPHEIGVFLGYPLTDVIGFVENNGKNYTCCGCWKSYGDAAAAQALFAQYKKCTRVYLRCYRGGTPLTRLTVAV